MADAWWDGPHWRNDVASKINEKAITGRDSPTKREPYRPSPWQENVG
jgi:hypothetical protein